MKKGDILVVLEVTSAFFLKAREESLFDNDHRKCPPGRGRVWPASGSGAPLKGTAAGPWWRSPKCPKSSAVFVPVMFYLTQKRSGVEYKRPALTKAVLGGVGAGALRLSGMAEKERPGTSGTSSAWAARGTRCGRTGMEPEPSRPPCSAALARGVGGRSPHGSWPPAPAGHRSRTAGRPRPGPGHRCTGHTPSGPPVLLGWLSPRLSCTFFSPVLFSSLMSFAFLLSFLLSLSLFHYFFFSFYPFLSSQF